MKKIFCFMLCATLLLGFAVSAFGAYTSTDLYDTKLTITNAAATVKMTVVPTSLVGTDATYELLKVDVGQCINHTGTSAEAVVGIYDAADASYWSNAFLECELESNDDTTATKTWIRPLKIYNGLLIVQGAYSVVTVEYQKAGR